MSFDLDKDLQKYADLAVHSGCALKQGQELYVSADVTQKKFVRLIVKSAYEAGASDVTVRFFDEQIGSMNYRYKPLEAFERFPEWRATLQNGLAKRGAALLFISSEDPESMKGVDPQKVATFSRVANEACKDWRDGMDFGRNVWCIIGAASPAWAKRVFPKKSKKKAVEALWKAIFKTVRVDAKDPEAAWKAHKESFDARTAWLNRYSFDALHYSNSCGTDITIGLTGKTVWSGGGDETVDGTSFFPNMPTEEIFTSPDRNRTEGTVVASMPLNHGGSLVEGFSLTFHEGRVIDYSAEKGYDVLKGIIETDEGSHYLGECALIPKTSPIKQTGILFLNTLFDENASCHFALGMGFPECYEGGRDMGKDGLLAVGVNDSATHVDFMLGTDDLKIVGICKNGIKVPIFENGNWAIAL